MTASSTDNKTPAMPCLLQGRKVIAATFRVHPDTVKAWALEGAPVMQVGGMWQADYGRMVEWLVRHKPARMEGGA